MQSKSRFRRRLTAEQVDQIYTNRIDKIRKLIGEKIGALPGGSAGRANLERLQSLSSEALVDDLFSRGNPNPDRIGCPSRDALRALARKERNIGDPAYDHLGECSPCYVEVLALKQAAAARSRG
jgi:hypothetical protein